MLANRPDTIEEQTYYQQILTYSVIVVLVGPLLVWAALVLPGLVNPADRPRPLTGRS